MGRHVPQLLEFVAPHSLVGACMIQGLVVSKESQIVLSPLAKLGQ